MAKIFISYSGKDKAYVERLVELLREHGQDVASDLNLAKGSDWRFQLTEALKTSEVFIIILSQASLSSAYPMAELGRALAMAENDKALIIPIAIEEIDIPTLLQDRLILFANNRDINEYFPEILSAIASYETRRERETINFLQVEQDITEFVEEAIKQQRAAEKTNRRWATFWYFVGVFSLFAVLVATSYSIYTAIVQSMALTGASSISIAFPAIALFTLNIVVIGVLAALARYAYSLGKSYMSESLKSSDRIHAIQFGKFFVKAFGNRLTPAEVKDAFQHWNIDRNSTFSSLDSAQIDPQIFALIGQLVGAVASKRDGK